MSDHSLPHTGSGEGTPPAISEADFQALVEMVGPEMPEVLVDLMETYLEESAGLVRTIREALTSGDLEHALRPAHSLKSSSASIGAMYFSRLCADLESHLRGSLPGLDIPNQVQKIENEFARVQREMVVLKAAYS
jgi:HPt (histidine-containing phosphotransfer) domain-containing protein